MSQEILCFGERQSDCRFFHFGVENLPISLRVSDLRALSVSGAMPVKLSISKCFGINVFHALPSSR
jgi:hypothetical protein